MSRITGKDAANLIEAYNSLYAPQEEVELTEEQVQEDFENWVNSLVEEGHDLSEYTWEDMYEYYINEDLIGDIRNNAGRAVSAVRSGVSAANRAAGAVNQAMVNRIRQNVPQGSFPGRRPQVSNLGSNYRGAELQAAARARASQVGTPRQGTAGGPTVGGNTPIGPARTAAPTPTRPAPAPTRPAPAPAAPVAAKPAPTAAPATPAATPPGPPSRYNPLMQRTFGYQTGNAPDQLAAASKGTSQATSDAAFKKSREMRQKLQSTGTLSQSFDIFDIVKGYLIDEGYAETEEAAAVIMANMSEEWREEILDEANKTERRFGYTGLERQASRNSSSQPEHLKMRMKLSQPLEPRGSVALKLHNDTAIQRQERHRERRGKKTKG